MKYLSLKLKPEERKPYFTKRLIALAIMAVGVALDLITKALATLYLKGNESVVLIKGVLQLTYAENTGAAFSSFTESRWVFLVASTVMIIAILVFIAVKKDLNLFYIVTLSMITAGGIGNMIERVGNGFVVDFIDFCLINFAIFNGADSFITVGAFLLVIAVGRETYLEEIKEKKAKAEKNQ